MMAGLAACRRPGTPLPRRQRGKVVALGAEKLIDARRRNAHREDAAAYLQALAHAPAADPLRQGIVDLWGELRTVLAADMRAVQEAGELGTWLDPDAMAAVLVAVANGFVVHALLDPNGPTVSAMAGQFGSLMLAVRQPR